MPTVPQRVKSFNQGRRPDLLQKKYAAMRTNAFVFLRGTCHLFYEDLPRAFKVKDNTRIWMCGDLHLENFGTYKGENRAVYFDLNDFDEAILGPLTWELARVLTSIRVAAAPTGFSSKKADRLCQDFVRIYVAHLLTGKAGFIEKDIVLGEIKKILLQLRLRKRSAFIDSRTVIKNGKRKLRLDTGKALPLTPAQKKKLVAFIDKWRSARPDRKFFKVLDAAVRIAGTGSLGVERYVILVKGHGKGKNYLLDLKQASPSCLKPHVKIKQPVWKNEADRITQVQYRVQGVAPALLSSVEFNGKPFILKELQPTQDKINLARFKGKMKKLEQIIDHMAYITASGHLRSGGREGSSITDELMEFAKKKDWQKQVLAYSKEYARQVEKDFSDYCQAYDKGFFSKP